MPSSECPRLLSEKLLAATLSCIASVHSGDWETASQLLRRREQILTQLERFGDISEAKETLYRVKAAEETLMFAMEAATREASEEIAKVRGYRAAQNAYSSLEATGSLLEQYG